MQTFRPSDQMVFETVIEDIQRLRVFLSTLTLTEVTWIFDLSQVDDCDSAGVALLIEAKRLSQLGKHQCELKGISPEMYSLIESCGMKNILANMS